MAQTEPMMQRAYDQTRSLAAPLVSTNRMAVTKLEQVLNFQLDALHGYVGLALERMRAASEIHNAQDLQSFYRDQLQATGVLQNMLIDHARGLMEMTAGIQGDFFRQFQENSRELGDKTVAFTRENSDKIATFTGRMADRTVEQAGRTTALAAESARRVSVPEDRSVK
ncbi:MAG: phasin family protein [Candidatus Competibacteraceae bacterium]|nr:phasin family protein [Candidatus Competibacteraceae bacterium]